MKSRTLTSLVAIALLIGAGAFFPAAAIGQDPDPGISAKDSEGVELPSRGDKKKDKKKKEEKSEQKGEEKKEEKSFEDFVKDHRKIDGLFTLYEKDGEYLISIKPDQFDKQYMVSVTRETGVGQVGLLAVQVLGENPVTFTRVGEKGVQMLWKNTRFVSPDDAEMQRAIDRSFSDSLLEASKIVGPPHPDTKEVLVEMTPFFTTDVEGVGLFLAEAFKSPFKADEKNSSIVAAKGFPKNMEIAARIHFQGQKPGPFVTLPDSRSMFITYRYSLSEVPASDGFVARPADDRVGHFITLYQDYSDDKKESPYVRYATRWNLQKEEPYAEMSKPKKPIVYWLENSIPKKYRKAMADGILLWNKAFEKIGYEDAIVVKQQPDDADWDPADVRYATVRWFVAADSSFAIGPSRINPLTGEIYDADISWAEALIRGRHREYEELSNPVAAVEALFSRLESMGRIENGDPRFSCSLATDAMEQLGFGWDLLEARGMEPGSAEEDEYVNGFVKYVMAHEMGHTLGLRHNFRSSGITANDTLGDEQLTGRKGLVGSVMDYVPVNLAPVNGRQGEYWPSTLGPYDYWAIEYAYREFPNVEKPSDMEEQLKKIASRVAELDNTYGTDEDTSDPRTNVWDLGSDPLAFYNDRAALVHELWSEIPRKLATEGNDYTIMRRAFGRGIGQIALGAFNVSKTIGGIYTHRDHVADPDGRLPFVPVPAARQRAGMEFLRKNLFDSSAFELPADLLNRLGLTRWWDFNFTIFGVPRMEYPLHDVVLAIQQGSLNALFNPVKLDRLVDMELYFSPNERPFTLAEMFSELEASIWSELDSSGVPRVGSFRRALQREHLKRLTKLIVDPDQGTPEDAATMARATLKSVRGKIQTALGKGSLDAATRAHLDETMARIDAALSAQMMRMAG